MPFGAPRHVVSIKCHTPSRRMPIGASRQVGHWKISGCLRDRCQLVHPIRRFILYHSIHIYDGFRLMNPFLIIIHIYSVFIYHISISYSLSYYLFKDILNLCTYSIYSFTYSFDSYLVTTKILEIRIKSENKPKLSNLASFSSISVLG